MSEMPEVAKPDSVISGAESSIVAAAAVVSRQDPLLRRKQLRAFEVMDVDGSGAITPSDTVGLAKKMASLTGYAEDSPRAKELVATVNEVWQEFVATPAWVVDPNRLDRDQFVTVMANSVVTKPDLTMRFIGVATNLTFAMADSDNDGRITKEDSIRLGVEILNVTREEAGTAWDTLDVTKDGYLNYTECLVAVTQFVTSTDPDAPGNLLLGRL